MTKALYARPPFAFSLRQPSLDPGAAVHIVCCSRLPSLIPAGHMQRDAIAINQRLAQPADHDNLDGVELAGHAILAAS